jgi:hypothetical protein
MIVDLVRYDWNTVCKVSGITLNYASSLLVKFDVIKNIILNGDETDIVMVHMERKIK